MCGMVDKVDLKSTGRNTVRIRISLLPVPELKKNKNFLIKEEDLWYNVYVKFDRLSNVVLLTNKGGVACNCEVCP